MRSPYCTNGNPNLPVRRLTAVPPPRRKIAAGTPHVRWGSCATCPVQPALCNLHRATVQVSYARFSRFRLGAENDDEANRGEVGWQTGKQRWIIPQIHISHGPVGAVTGRTCSMIREYIFLSRKKSGEEAIPEEQCGAGFRGVSFWMNIRSWRL